MKEQSPFYSLANNSHLDINIKVLYDIRCLLVSRSSDDYTLISNTIDQYAANINSNLIWKKEFDDEYINSNIKHFHIIFVAEDLMANHIKNYLELNSNFFVLTNSSIDSELSQGKQYFWPAHNKIHIQNLHSVIDYIFLIYYERALFQGYKDRIDLALNILDEFIYFRPIVRDKYTKNIVQFLNNKVENILGYTESELLNNPDIWDIITHPDDMGWMYDADWFSNLTESDHSDIMHVSHEVRLKPKNKNDYIWIQHKLIPYYINDSDLIGFIGIGKDISYYKETLDRLSKDALHDELTGLPNRSLFMDRLDHALLRSKRKSTYIFAVLFIDLDKFKNINDSMGHLVGDKVLMEVSERLSDFLRASDTVARLGGDEFAILLEDIAHHDDSIFVSERLQDLLAKPIIVDQLELYVTASIGIAVNSNRYEHADEVLNDADVAMYKAKSEGRARSELYDSELHNQSIASYNLDNELQKALAKEEFRVSYEPIYMLNSHKVIGFEANLTWQHPNKGLLAAKDFMHALESSGLIIKVNYWLLEKVCEKISSLIDAGFYSSFEYFVINLSPRQVTEIDLIEQIDKIIHSAGVSYSKIRLDITEDVITENIDYIGALLAQLDSMGVRLNISSFGSESSSLRHLYTLPIYGLEVDTSLVNDIQPDLESSAVKFIDAIVTVAHKLDLAISAKNIESEFQASYLARSGCDLAQGKYFSSTLTEQKLEVFLQSSASSIQSH